jgi:hypothetical protein
MLIGFARLMSLLILPSFAEADDAGGGAADTSDSPKTGDATGDNGGNAGAADKADDKRFTQAEVDKLISNRLSRESKKLRDEVKAELERDAETQRQHQQGEFKPLYEQAQSRIGELETELRTLKAQAILGEAGVIRPKLLVAELSDEALDDDKVRERDIAKMRKSYPELFRATNGSADGGQHAPVGSKRGMNELIREAAGVPS